MQQIPGSKPRKLIRRQNLSNPSLYFHNNNRISYSIKPVFDPDYPSALTERQRVRQTPGSSTNSNQNHRGQNRARSQISFGYDALQQASQQFVKKKNSIHLPNTNIISHINRKNVQQAIQQKLKLNGYQQVVKNINIQNSSKFNFIRSDSIKAKQRHGYDIINGRHQI